ncbi:hypothetical protein RND81_14G143200 [Saponaria officinalis]|uniref:DUF4283 domain-containing protein n=1 Tax=Saponaria officinalis TaxID=3572 RepID=A0AAW1GW97_SAPOF
MAVTRKARVPSIARSTASKGAAPSSQLSLEDFLSPQFGDSLVPPPPVPVVDTVTTSASPGSVPVMVDASTTGNPTSDAWKNRIGCGVKEKQGLELEFIESDDNLVRIELEEVVEEVEYWANTLVGFVLGGNPHVNAMSEFTAKHWNHVARPQILFHSKGWFFFKFASKADMEVILKGGPWNFKTRQLILKPWTTSFSFVKERVSTVPVWVLLPNLDVQFWSAKALSKIASRVGKPLYTDKCTECKAKISFARVLVEVELMKDLIYEVRIQGPFGHSNEKCKKLAKVRAKEVVVEPAVESVNDVGVSVEGHGTVVSGEQPVSEQVRVETVVEVHNEGTLLKDCRRRMGRLSWSHLMFLSAWNIRGLNAPSKQQELRSFLLLHKVDLVGILETRVKEHNALGVQRKVFPRGWKLVSNYQCHPNGRIWVAWRSARVHLDILGIYDQLVWCLVQNNGVEFYLGLVYGLNDREGRQRLWSLVASLMGGSAAPCLLIGDFNVTLFVADRKSSYAADMASIEDFRSCCASNGLVDLHFTGFTFTWYNKQEGLDRTWCKLDRVMGNAAWFQSFGVAAEFLAAGISDHSPALLNLDPAVGQRHGGFKFLNGWLQDPQVHSLIEDAWGLDVRGTRMFKLISKLKAVKRQLRSYHRTHFKNISHKVDQAREALSLVQAELQLHPWDSSLMMHERQLLQGF